MFCFSFVCYKCSCKNTMTIFYYKNKDFNPLESYHEVKLFNGNSLCSKVSVYIETLPRGKSHAPVCVLLLLLT